MVDVPLKVIADPNTHYGDGRKHTRAVVIQRITGAINLLLTLFLIWFVVRLAGSAHDELTAAIRNPLVWAPLLVLVINVPIHMRIGMNEVIEDYVHEPRLVRFSLMANTYVALVVALAGAAAVLKLAFWG
jgi:succinate dehydrogenase / fumarate reductase membrane anchor subunit